MSRDKKLVFLGHGRSASVYKLNDEGVEIARKLFTGSSTADIVMSLFYGAPVDYQWNKQAVKCAFFRRRVLHSLLKFWFGGRVSISNAVNMGYDKEHKAFYIDTEFVKGEVAPLYTPFSNDHISEYNDLKDIIFPELQKKLLEAGFVGTVWQVGYGQPCSIPNFLCVRYDDNIEQERWVWIDAESGVPALASHSIVKQLTFYIPQALKRRRVLFDDIDSHVLNNYIEEHSEALQATLSGKEFDTLSSDVATLLEAYEAWRSDTRFTRTIKYLKNQDMITESRYNALCSGEASKLYFLLTFYLVRQLSFGVNFICRKSLNIFKAFNPLKWMTFFMKSAVSRKYRIKKSHEFMKKRIGRWEAEHKITPEEGDILRNELYLRESNQYFSDFGVFLALKPFGYFIKLCIIPILLLHGILSPEYAIFIIAFLSITLRTTYALVRCIEDVVLHRSFPYIALLVAPIPSVGTLAYPCQMIHSARKGHAISKFIIYEMFSAIARKFPIWGGEYSEIEYFLNRQAFKMIKASE